VVTKQLAIVMQEDKQLPQAYQTTDSNINCMHVYSRFCRGQLDPTKQYRRYKKQL